MMMLGGFGVSFIIVGLSIFSVGGMNRNGFQMIGGWGMAFIGCCMVLAAT